ncbi:MAG: hypothetical protein OS130_01160 [Thermodesulfobacteriota bacterium]|jgi:hypothetical protein|nr:MAG: hypothetical protein OS130_01160 [Thermodesulfobacteriota bacterium]
MGQIYYYKYCLNSAQKKYSKINEVMGECKMSKKTGNTIFKVGRDAGTGKFIPVKVAQRITSTTVVETIKIPKKK